MSEDNSAPERQEPLPETKASPNFSLAAAWVQGGTRTAEHDKEVARRKADAEKRREELDAQQRHASIPIERGGAKMFSSNFAEDFDPKVLLQYPPLKMQILCELVKDADGEWLITVTCPECVRAGMPQDQAQFHVKQSHRKWSIDERERGEAGTYEDVEFFTGKKIKQVYVKAGNIMDTEVLRCPHVACGGVRYRIDNNVLRRQ